MISARLSRRLRTPGFAEVTKGQSTRTLPAQSSGQPGRSRRRNSRPPPPRIQTGSTQASNHSDQPADRPSDRPRYDAVREHDPPETAPPPRSSLRPETHVRILPPRDSHAARPPPSAHHAAAYSVAAAPMYPPSHAP